MMSVAAFLILDGSHGDMILVNFAKKDLILPTTNYDENKSPEAMCEEAWRSFQNQPISFPGVTIIERMETSVGIIYVCKLQSEHIQVISTQRSIGFVLSGLMLQRELSTVFNQDQKNKILSLVNP
jgi:hypothetical protein